MTLNNVFCFIYINLKIQLFAGFTGSSSVTGAYSISGTVQPIWSVKSSAGGQQARTLLAGKRLVWRIIYVLCKF